MDTESSGASSSFYHERTSAKEQKPTSSSIAEPREERGGCPSVEDDSVSAQGGVTHDVSCKTSSSPPSDIKERTPGKEQKPTTSSIAEPREERGGCPSVEDDSVSAQDGVTHVVSCKTSSSPPSDIKERTSAKEQKPTTSSIAEPREDRGGCPSVEDDSVSAQGGVAHDFSCKTSSSPSSHTKNSASGYPERNHNQQHATTTTTTSATTTTTTTTTSAIFTRFRSPSRSPSSSPHHSPSPTRKSATSGSSAASPAPRHRSRLSRYRGYVKSPPPTIEPEYTEEESNVMGLIFGPQEAPDASSHSAP